MEAMPARPPLPPGPFLVVGLARSGVAAALALREQGQAVVGCDAGEIAPEARAGLERAGVDVHAPDDGVALLPAVRTIVKSPGVPQEAPVVSLARRQGRLVIGELELAWRLLPQPFVAVTGSNGKTTTVELIGHIHRAAGVPVVVAGNVGTPLASLTGASAPLGGGPPAGLDSSRGGPGAGLDSSRGGPPAGLDPSRGGPPAGLDPSRGRPAAGRDPSRGGATPRLDPAAIVVCEASSFQLEDTEHFAPDAAVLLNLSDDHLDRHGTFEAYRDAKLQAFARQDAGALAVLPDDLDVAQGGHARVVRFGDGPDADLRGRGGRLLWRGAPLMPADELRLRGAHNRQNAMAAAAVALARGLDAGAVRTGLATFTGVPHRLEEVATVGGVLYVNDSKATNVASAVVGIRSFPGGVHAILGGRGKGSDYAPLAGPVAERCAAAYLIGETAAELGLALEPTGVPLHLCGDLERAVARARVAARAGDVVLLSPACASYDQYPSFEERGAHFRALVDAG
jgi:UDP-N-acetylmuramoylalanine-D-glutamate ligase